MHLQVAAATGSTMAAEAAWAAANLQLALSKNALQRVNVSLQTVVHGNEVAAGAKDKFMAAQQRLQVGLCNLGNSWVSCILLVCCED